MADYDTLIDTQTWAFIERTKQSYPDDAVDFPVADQRRVYDRMCREFFAGYPDGISADDGWIGSGGKSIPVRRYRAAFSSAEAQIVYCHGGGFVVGGLESHDDVCAELCARTGFPVMAVDYRLAPEHTHPAAFDDALAAFEAASTDSGLPVVLAGDSAGGNLCAAVSHAARKRTRRPVGQVLIYPALGGNRTEGSYVEHAEAPMLTARDIDFYQYIRTGGDDPGRDPTYAPLDDDDFSGLPPTVIVTAQCDPLADDGRDYRDAILAAGGQAVWINETGLVHGYLRARHTVERARASFDRIAEAVKALGERRWSW